MVTTSGEKGETLLGKVRTAAVLVACASVATQRASAQTAGTTPLQRLLACKNIADRPARLDCYDGRASEVDEAIARRDLVVADRAEVAATRRSLFGFSVPRIPLLERAASEPPPPERFDTTLASASRSGDRWVLVLAEGGRWEQVDAGREADEPRAGMPISIRRASFGTYFARIGSRIAMRIRRVG